MQLFDPKVRLDEDSHRYLDGGNNEFVGFSRFYDNFLCRPFASTPIAAMVAFHKGVEKQEVLDEWQAKTDRGTYYDQAITECAKNPEAIQKYPDIAEIITAFLREYEQYHECYEKLVVFNEYYKIAGEIDKCGVTSHRKGNSFDLSDIKVFDKDDLYVPRGWMFEPLNHLPTSKFHKITMQLSFYAFQLEELTGRRCRNLYIHVIDPNTGTQKKVYTPYLKTDILLVLEHNKEKIANLVTKQETIF